MVQEQERFILNSLKVRNAKKKFFLILLLSLIFFSCKASSRYYKEKLSTHKELAKLFIKENKNTEALRELELAKKTNKCDPEIYNLFGLVYMGKQEYAKAEKNLKRAIELKPNFSGAYNNLGALMLLEKRYKKAIYYFKKALQNPYYINSYIALTNLGWTYFQLGDKKKAINILLKAMRENPRYPKVLIYLGLIHFKDNDLKTAKFYFKQALKLNKMSGEARYYLGEVFFREGNIKLAKELWQSIIYLTPHSQWANKATERIYFLERTSS